MITVKELEEAIDDYKDLGLLLARCRSTIHELATIGKRHYERAERAERKLAEAEAKLEEMEERAETLTKLNDQYSDDYIRDRDKIIKLEAQLEHSQNWIRGISEDEHAAYKVAAKALEEVSNE